MPASIELGATTDFFSMKGVGIIADLDTLFKPATKVWEPLKKEMVPMIVDRRLPSAAKMEFTYQFETSFLRTRFHVEPSFPRYCRGRYFGIGFLRL